MYNYRSSRARSSSNERNRSEGLVDLHVYVIPAEQWKNHLSSVLHQLVTDSISAGYIRVHPESLLSDLRQEINSQLGHDSVPRDYIFLRCLGRSFTQVKEKQERELKAKYFMPPHTYSPELYVLDASSAQRFSPSSQSSHQSFSGKQSSRALLSPPSYPTATRTYANHDHGYNDLEKASELLRQKPREEEWRRKRPQDLEEEEKQRRRLREEEEEDERTRRIIEELEAMRREELEHRRKANEADDRQRMRKLEEEEEEDRMRLRRLVEEEGRRGRGVHLMESPFEEFSRPKTPSPTPRQRTFERHEPRDAWKKRFQEERRRPSPPRDDKIKYLKEELDNINRRITDHMETIRDGGKRTSHSQPNHNDKAMINSKLQATQMEHEIEDLERKLQSTKLQLTAEMKLRNQCEQELLNLRSELEKMRANSLPRLEERVTTRIIEVPVYIKEPRKPETPPPPPPPEPIPVAHSGALEEAFKVFATKNNGVEATGADIFKWGADAGIIGKSMNNHHIDISFHKVKPKGMKTITVKELYPLIDELAYKYADDTKLSYQGARKRIIDRMANAPFKLHGATLPKAGSVARLANGSKAPGSQKTRFHPSTGNGGGRQDGGMVLESREYNHKYN